MAARLQLGKWAGSLGPAGTRGCKKRCPRLELEKAGEGFEVTRSDLELTAEVPGIDEARLRELAEGAKAGCPISKLLKAEMELTVRSTAQA